MEGHALNEETGIKKTKGHLLNNIQTKIVITFTAQAEDCSLSFFLSIFPIEVTGKVSLNSIILGTS